MAYAISAVLFTLIVCVTGLLAMYMYYCHDDGIKMFEDVTRYEERILELEKAVKELKEM